MSVDIGEFSLATGARVKGPSPATGYSISPTRGNEDDSARYILRPDLEFYRPWLANPPHGSAFVWPLGIQGFTYASTATTGIHHYIGDNDVDVDVVYPDELHITLSGHFPGRTASQFMQALRKVILDPGDDSGKILSLPGVEQQIQYVKVINHNFTHDETDLTSSIAYTIECIKVGAGRSLDISKLQPTIPNPTHKTAHRGKASKQIISRQGGRTARALAKKMYGSTSAAAMYQLINANATELEKNGIPAFTVPYSPLPSGQILTL